jgi:hypothetical protein
VLTLLAGTQAVSDSTGTDWTLIAALPGALVALATLALYAIGSIRPLTIREAVYWSHPGAPAGLFTCYVKNRSPLYDRTLTGLVPVQLPASRFDRLFRVWRKQLQDADVMLTGSFYNAMKNGELKITKNDEVRIDGVIRQKQGGEEPPALGKLSPLIRIEARAGSKRSRSKPLRKL